MAALDLDALTATASHIELAHPARALTITGLGKTPAGAGRPQVIQMSVQGVDYLEATRRGG